MHKHIAANGLNGIIVVMILGLAISTQFSQWQERGNTLTAPVCVNVEPQDSLQTVGNRLENLGVVDDARLFRIYARSQDKAPNLQPGSFTIAPQATPGNVLDTLMSQQGSTCGTQVTLRVGASQTQTVIREINPDTGSFEALENIHSDPQAQEEARTAALNNPATQFWLTITEGVSVNQVVSALSEAPFLTGSVDVTIEEGMLATDSFIISPQQDRNAVVRRLVTEQERRIAAVWETVPENSPLESPDDLLILASIIEREAGNREEMPKISSVFHNRMAQGMRLQADATVVYGVTQGTPLRRAITREDLDTDTPWNTYTRSGLPQTPIANPGRAALEAAANPATTNHLFFVADGTGGHVFADTYEEHRENVERWRAIRTP